jgi:hypothetical protein
LTVADSFPKAQSATTTIPLKRVNTFGDVLGAPVKE